MPPNVLVNLLRPLYGLSDAGDYWHDTFAKHMTKDLGMARCFAELALFYKHVTGELMGIDGTDMNDTLLTGNVEFKEIKHKTGERFSSRSADKSRISFSGIELSSSLSTVLLQQPKQAERMRFIPPSATDSEFRSALDKMAWLCHTRPDVTCAVAEIAQTSDHTFHADHVSLLNAATRVIRKDPARGMRHRKLNVISIWLVAYADGLFANKKDGSSQLGYLIVMEGATGC